MSNAQLENDARPENAQPDSSSAPVTSAEDAEAHPALSPLRIGSVRLPNRAAVAPMSRVSTSGDGLATARMRDYYARFARGGFGLVITEGVYPDADRSQAYWNQPGIATEEQARAWRPVAEAIQGAGALVQENRATPTDSPPQPSGRRARRCRLMAGAAPTRHRRR